MFKNYLRIAWADLKKNKVFSFINICGLAFGMSLCMLIITIIKDQLSYDTFHPNADRAYRVNTVAIRKDGGTEPYASSPLPVSVELKQNYPFIEHAVNLTRGLNGEATVDSKTINVDGFFTNSEFLDVFGYELLYGNKSAQFNEPNTVVLTQKTPVKFFKNKNPVGKVITVKGLGDFKVSGVLKDPPGKTHLEFDLLGSDNFLPVLDKQSPGFTVINNWLNYYANYTYVTLKNNDSKPALERALAKMGSERYKKLDLESRDKGYQFVLQPLTEIVPGPMLSNNMGRALPVEMLWALGIFAFVIIISAAFNYNSLSLAHALSRAKEIGVRKAAGAQRYQLILQFLIQSVFTSFLSMLVAWVIYHFALIPFFQSFSLFGEFDISLDEDAGLIMIFTLFSIFIGLIAGLFPSLYLSSFNPSRALKDIGSFNFLPKLGLRKVLLVIQFSAALLFVVTLINIYRQINYLMNADYGFRKDDIINVDLQNNNYALVKQAFEKQNGVVEVSGISHSMGTWRDRGIDVRLTQSSEKISARDYSVDADYIPNLSLQLIAGKNFSKDLPASRELYIIVNQEFLKFFKLGTPSEAIGKHVILGDSINVSILGVLKNFHFKPFTYAMEPLVLRYNLDDITELNVQVTGKNAQQTLAELQTAWNSIDKNHAFTYRFFADELKDTYQFYADITKFVGLVAFMAVTIACMGLLGLVLFVLKHRTKEIGIRKILGASLPQLSILLSKNFAKLMLIACLVGLPLGIWLNNSLFNEFAYRINLNTGYVTGICLLIVFAVVTIGSQIVRAAVANPVKSLRTE
jgi:putative ABC transport system permease protein